MAKKRLRIKDSSGNVVPYDVSAADVTLQDGTNVETAISGLGAGTVKGVKMNNTVMPENNGIVDLGKVVTEHQSLAPLFGKVAYDSATRRINFFGKDDVMMTNVLGWIDASPFIVDGFLSSVDVKNVTISGTSTLCMVFTFNTDAGMQDINVPVSAIFDASQYYTKGQANETFQVKLISGTNIKTINNEPVLGEGNISIPSGDDGKSAYQSYVDTTDDNPVMTEEEWSKAILRSAYLSYLATTSDNPKKTEAEWVASLKGEKGDTLLVDGNFNPVTDIVNDMTTGGANKAWSAEMGKQLAADVDDIPVIDIHVDGRKLVINTNAALAPRVVAGDLSKPALSCRAGNTDIATFNVSGRRLTGNIGIEVTGGTTHFSVSPGSLIPSGGEVATTQITVTYTPGSGATAGDTHNCTVIISSGDVTYGTLQLTGTVAAAPSIQLTPASLTISTESGQSATGTINVKGTALDGDISLAISGSGFSLSDNIVSKAEAERAGGKDITVTFDGSADGATGTITASSAGATSVEASVSGSVRERLAVGDTITEGNLLYTVLTGRLTVSVQKAATAPTGAVTIPSIVYDDKGFDYNVVSIPSEGFKGTQITSIVLPDTLKDIGQQAFYGCSSLASIDFGDGLESISGNSAFFGTKLVNVVLPDSLKTCANAPFQSIMTLKSIQLGKTTAFNPTSIGNILNWAGSSTDDTNDNSLDLVICYATTPPTLSNYPRGIAGAVLKVPSGSVSAYQAANNWDKFGTIEAI